MAFPLEERQATSIPHCHTEFLKLHTHTLYLRFFLHPHDQTLKIGDQEQRGM